MEVDPKGSQEYERPSASYRRGEGEVMKVN